MPWPKLTDKNWTDLRWRLRHIEDAVVDVEAAVEEEAEDSVVDSAEDVEVADMVDNNLEDMVVEDTNRVDMVDKEEVDINNVDMEDREDIKEEPDKEDTEEATTEVVFNPNSGQPPFVHHG